MLIKIEICSFTDFKGGKTGRIHGDFIFWQQKNRTVKCKLSHDKRYVLFDDEKEFEKFTSSWGKPWRKIY